MEVIRMGIAGWGREEKCRLEEEASRSEDAARSC